MDDVITIILVCAGLSLLLNIALKRFQVESMIGYLLTGTLVGFVIDLQQSDSLHRVAEFGIVFLMFTIGVEFSAEKLRLMRREVFLFGPLQVVVTTGILFVIGHSLLVVAPAVNLITSLALSLSSTAIVLSLLSRSGKISRRYGRNAVGVLLFQDISVIPILLMVSIFSRSQGNVPQLLLEVVADGVVVFLLFIGSRFLTPFVMKHVIGSRSNELFVGAILLFVVGSAQLAHELGFTYSLGAFLAGMVIAETQYKHQVEADLTPFRDLLLGVFFITVGMQVDPLFVVSNLPLILAVMVGLLLLKSLVLYTLMRLFTGPHTALKTALLLAQCGEFSFVVFETARAGDLFMDPRMAQILVVAIVLTMMLPPLVFRYLDPITLKLVGEPEQRKGDSDEQVGREVDDCQVVVCGYGTLGQRVGGQLDAAGVSFIAIEHDGNTFRACRDRGMPVYFGNAGSRRFLERIRIEQSRAVVIALSNELRILRVAHAVRSVAPDVPIVATATGMQLGQELRCLGLCEPIDGVEQAAQGMVRRVMALEQWQQPGAGA